MKHILPACLFLQMLFGSIVSAQAVFERRIIIEADTFYAVEIDRPTQVGKLYKGNINQPVDSAVIYALPAGARMRNKTPQSFAWTLHNDSIYCINATEYAMNSHVNSLKAIPLKFLGHYDAKANPTKLLIQAALGNCRIKNIPLSETYAEYVYADDLYYDLVMYNNTLYQFIAVMDEFKAWHYENGQWTASDVLPMKFEGPFVAYVRGDRISLVNGRGDEFEYPSLKHNPAGSNTDPAKMLLVEDRDAGKYYFVPSGWFDDTTISVKRILEKAK